MNGHLILGKSTIIVDITCMKSHAVVIVKGKAAPIHVPYDAVSWVSDDWEF